MMRRLGGALAMQALPERAVLAVYRANLDPAAPRRGHHQMPRHHQRLLVGEGDGLAGADRRQHRLDPYQPRGRRDDDLDVWMRGRRGEGRQPQLRAGQQRL